MPGIRLDLEIDDKGTAVIKRFSQTAKKELSDTERAADRSLGKTEKRLEGVGGAANRSSASFAALTGNVLRAAPAFAVATAAISGVYMALRKLRDEFTGGLKAVEDYNLRVASMTAFMTTFSKAAAEGNIAKGFRESNDYAKELVKTLEIIDAKTVATGKDLSIMAETMIQNGVLLDINNQKQIEGFINIANALKLMTKGMNQDVQMRQEIRALMTGQLRDTNVLIKLLESKNANIKESIDIWIKEGTVLENVGKMLSGFQASTGLIERTWEAVGSTLETIHDRVLRGAFKPIYEDLLELSLEIKDAFMDTNGELTQLAKNIQKSIQDAWESTKKWANTIEPMLPIFAKILKYLALIKAAQIAWNIVTRANPWIIGGTIILTALAYMDDFIDKLKEATKSQEELNRAMGLKSTLGGNKPAQGVTAADLLRSPHREGAITIDPNSAFGKAYLAEQKKKGVELTFGKRLEAQAPVLPKPPELVPRGESAEDIAKTQKEEEKRYKELAKLQKEEQRRLEERGRLIAEQRKLEEKIALAILPEHERKIKEIQIKYRELREDVQRVYDFDLSFNLEDIEKRQAALADLAQREREEIQKTNEEWSKKQLKLDEYQKAFQHFLDNLHDAGVDFFRSLLDGGINSWKDALDAFKNYFKQFLAELLALAIARPITISIVGSIAGAFGMGNIASIAGASGGGGNSLISSFGGLGGLGSVAGGLGGMFKDFFTPGVGISTGIADFLDDTLGLSSLASSISLIPDFITGGLVSALATGLLTGDWQKAVTSGVGAAIGTAIFPGIGTVLGGFVGGLFGGDGYDNPSVAFGGRGIMRQGELIMKATPRVDTGDADLDAEKLSKGMMTAAEKIFNAWDDTLKNIAEALGDKGEEWLESINGLKFDIKIWELVDSNFAKTFADSMNREIFEGLRKKLRDALGIFQEQANQKITSSGAWEYMADEWVKETVDALEPPKISKEFNAKKNMRRFQKYVDRINAIEEYLTSIAELTIQIEFAADDRVISDFENSWTAVNTQFEEWKRQLEELGVDLAKFSALEKFKNKSLDDLFMSAFDDIQDVIDSHELSEKAYKIKQGLPEIQKWYDQQLAMLEFLRGEGRITEGDYASHLADLNKAMAYKAQDLQSSFENAYVSLKDFFNEMDLSDLAPGQSLDAFKHQYETLLQGGLSEELLNFVKNEYLPFAKTYTGGVEDYNTFYNQIMADLRGLTPGDSMVAPGLNEQTLSQALYNAIMAVKAEGGAVGEMHFHIIVNDKEIVEVVNENIAQGNIVI